MHFTPQVVYLYIITAPNIILGLFILLRNLQDNVNRHFSAFAFGVGMWSLGLGLYTSTSDLATARGWAQFYYIAAASIAASFMFFCQYFAPKKTIIKKSVYIILLIPLIVITALTIFYPQWIINSVVQRSWGKEVILNKTGYTIYSIYFVGYVLYGFFTNVKNILKSHGLFKVYLKFALAGLIIAFSLGMAFNLILPALGNYKYIWVGPQFTLFYVMAISYAIVRHKLFDIRAVVFRAVVYLLTLSLVGFLYAAIVITAGTFFVDMNSIDLKQRFFFTLLALITATTYKPIVVFFNKLTTKLFYRDAYDVQEVVDKVGKIIVGNIDLHKIQRESLEVLQEALKPTFMTYLLYDAEKRIRPDGLNTETWLSGDSKPLERALKHFGNKLVSYDELQESDKYKSVLRNQDINLIAPLATKNEIIGYLVAGAKKSGNIYNDQDQRLFSLAANELAVALQNAERFEEIQAFNITLQEKINDATKELKKTNKKLVELDEAKDEFISMASHQLRTPLTSIKGYLSMLIEGDLGKVSKEQDQALKEAFTSSQRMVFLIADFLNVSRIKTGKFVIEPKEINMVDMIKEELVQLREMAEAKQLKMVFDPPTDFPIVKLDENKMHQVMMNMMDNAIYYTPSSGTITIQLYIDGKDVVFKVVDTGIGVPKSEQHKLFTKFFRAGNARKTRPDGTGLGLFMAQKVVVAQGGSIIFESEEGKGSTFGFRFSLHSIKP
jgi:signal transduction histidine kinase